MTLEGVITILIMSDDNPLHIKLDCNMCNLFYSSISVLVLVTFLVLVGNVSDPYSKINSKVILKSGQLLPRVVTS